jgi:hypothetical protein
MKYCSVPSDDSGSHNSALRASRELWEPTLDTRAVRNWIQPTRVYSITRKPCSLSLIHIITLRRVAKWSHTSQTTRKVPVSIGGFISRRIKGGPKKWWQAKAVARGIVQCQQPQHFTREKSTIKVHGETARRSHSFLPSYYCKYIPVRSTKRNHANDGLARSTTGDYPLNPEISFCESHRLPITLTIFMFTKIILK